MVFDLYDYRSPTRMPYPTVLGRGEIRLAAILPGEWGSEIKCEIFRAPWLTESKMPEYKALSYSWGFQSSSPPSILVNDSQFEVTPNLECALRHLRRLDKPVVLWVDALVSQMRKIYSRATEVIVFLDPTEETFATVRFSLLRLEEGEHPQEGQEELDKIRREVERWVEAEEHMDPLRQRERFKDSLGKLEALAALEGRNELDNICKVLEEFGNEFENGELRAMLHQWRSRRIIIV